MLIGTVRESAPGERRVAITPVVVGALGKLKAAVIVERGCGVEAGFTDEMYAKAGAELASREEVFAKAAVVCLVRTAGANPTRWRDDAALMRRGQAIVALSDPLGSPEPIRELAERGVTLFALELLPRITRAQSMDVLSSQAGVAGYKAVLLAATHLPRFLPMFMTAAGTITAAKVMVVGAGVAGLQAIATAKRNGAIVSGYDVRSVVKEQIESLGAKFVDLGLDAQGADAASGYAKALDEAFYERQRAALARVAADQDAIITTAAIPGKRSPLLITRAAVEDMKPGSVIVDLAAERGGNCELAKPDEIVVHHGVTILGPTNLPSTVPHDASQMFARNVAAFLAPMVKESDALKIDLEDEVIRATLVFRDGEAAPGPVAGSRS